MSQIEMPAVETVQTGAGLIRLVEYLISNADTRAVADLPWDRLCDYAHLREAGNMLEAHACNGSQHSHCGVHIAVRFSHEPTKPFRKPTTKPRLFDPLFFAALLLMEWAGVRFTFHYCGVDDMDRYYLRLTGRGPRPYVARIVCDALSGNRAMMENDHHSYCFADLAQAAPDNRLASPRRGRADAVTRACELFKKRPPADAGGFALEDFRLLLTAILDTATRIHGRPTTR